jgi:hypothetical protein
MEWLIAGESEKREAMDGEQDSGDSKDRPGEEPIERES